MGLHINTYRQAPYGDPFFDNMDCTAGGESSYCKGFTIMEIDGPFEPNEDYPRAFIEKQSFGFGCSLKLVPEGKEDKWTMFGGNYATTSDSRFGDYCRKLMGDDCGNVYGLGPVAIHDRVEG